MLEFTDYEPTSSLVLEPPRERKSPTIAFLLALLWPGVGHLYLHEFKKATWLMVMHFIGIAFILANSTFALQGWLMFPALYVFGFVDAYHSAREWNAGASSRMIGASPRIAALLNFLTKGFGYFYLGERAKGVVCFICISILQGLFVAFHKGWLTALSISIQVAIAIDVYRNARNQLLITNPELQGEAIAIHNPGGIPAVVPVALGTLVFTATLAAFGTTALFNGKSIHHNGKLEVDPDGLHYSDDVRKVSFTAPGDWYSWKTRNSLIAVRNTSCNAILMEQLGIDPIGKARDQLVTIIRSQHTDAVVQTSYETISGRRAAVALLSYRSGETPIHQKYFIARRGFSSFSLIESWPDGENCTSEFKQIEQTLKL